MYTWNRCTLGSEITLHGWGSLNMHQHLQPQKPSPCTRPACGWQRFRAVDVLQKLVPFKNAPIRRCSESSQEGNK